MTVTGSLDPNTPTPIGNLEAGLYLNYQSGDTVYYVFTADADGVVGFDGQQSLLMNGSQPGGLNVQVNATVLSGAPKLFLVDGFDLFYEVSVGDSIRVEMSASLVVGGEVDPSALIRMVLAVSDNDGFVVSANSFDTFSIYTIQTFVVEPGTPLTISNAADGDLLIYAALDTPYTNGSATDISYSRCDGSTFDIGGISDTNRYVGGVYRVEGVAGIEFADAMDVAVRDSTEVLPSGSRTYDKPFRFWNSNGEARTAVGVVAAFVAIADEASTTSVGEDSTWNWIRSKQVSSSASKFAGVDFILLSNAQLFDSEAKVPSTMSVGAPSEWHYAMVYISMPGNYADITSPTAFTYEAPPPTLHRRAFTGRSAMMFLSTSGLTEIPAAEPETAEPDPPEPTTQERVYLGAAAVYNDRTEGHYTPQRYGSEVVGENTSVLMDADDSTYIDLRVDVDDVDYEAPDATQIDVPSYSIPNVAVTDVEITIRMESDWPNGVTVSVGAYEPISIPSTPSNTLGTYTEAGPIALGDYTMTLGPATASEMMDHLRDAAQIWVTVSGTPDSGTVRSVKVYDLSILVTAGE